MSGFQPGNKHGNRWPPGVSGNPKGRPPMTPEQREARRLAKAEVAASLATLVALRDGAEVQGVRASCAVHLLKLAGVSFNEDGAPVEDAPKAPTADMSEAELAAVATQGDA